MQRKRPGCLQYPLGSSKQRVLLFASRLLKQYPLLLTSVSVTDLGYRKVGNPSHITTTLILKFEI